MDSGEDTERRDRWKTCGPLGRLAAAGAAALLLVSCSASSVLAPPAQVPTSSISAIQPAAATGTAAAPSSPFESRPPVSYGAPQADVAALPSYGTLTADAVQSAPLSPPSASSAAGPGGQGLYDLQGGRALPVDDAALAQQQVQLGMSAPSDLPPDYVPSGEPQLLGTLGGGQQQMAAGSSDMMSAAPSEVMTADPAPIDLPPAEPVYAPASIAAAPEPVAPPVAAAPQPVAPAPATIEPVREEPRRLAGLLPRALNPFSRARRPESGLPAEEAACRQRLNRLGVTFTDKPAVGNGRSCGIAHPVEVSSLSGNVRVAPATMLNCRMAEAFATWVKQELAPGVRKRYLSGIHTVGSMGGYSCRTMNSRRGAPMSEHAKGNAIDIGSIRLNSGKTIMVRSKGFFAFRERGLLNSVRDDGCKYFTTILGPGSDANHADHFHFDLRARRNGYRHCD